MILADANPRQNKDGHETGKRQRESSLAWCSSLRVAELRIDTGRRGRAAGPTTRVPVARAEAIGHALVVWLTVALRPRVIQVVVLEFSVVLLYLVINVFVLFAIHLVDTVVDVQIRICQVGVLVLHRGRVLVLQAVRTC